MDERQSIELPRPVVALGASAGGLDAFREFLRGVAPDSGMAFVIVQHLDPRQPGVLPELLAACTDMPVRAASEGEPLERDTVYVIPPNVRLGIRGGRLVVDALAPGEQRQAIDVFMRALAEDQGHNAVGIVLSGIGTDGTLGLKAIKTQGGLTLAQTPNTARYDAMPRSAIVSGLVDGVMPVAEMPARLAEYAEHLRQLSSGQPLDMQLEVEERLGELLELLRERTGQDFRQYKKKTLARRVQRRIQIEQLSGFSQYMTELTNDPLEAERLVRDLLVGVTEFFRDPEAFGALKREVLDRLVDEQPNDIRVWVPGCATGEEAYSIAMLLSEAFDAAKQPARAQIFATDLDERALEVARVGHYPASIAESVSAQRLERHFERDGNGFAIQRTLRELCIFSQHDLVTDPPFSRLDLVSCRNLLIYFEPELQQRAIELFHYALRDGGHLFLGPSESAGGRGELFRAVDKRHRIFLRKPALLHRTPGFRATDLGRVLRRTAEQTKKTSPTLAESLPRALEAVLMEQLAPPAMVVNDQGDVVFVSGRSGKYIEPQTGILTLNAVNLVLKPLRPNLRTALHQAIRTKSSVVHENLSVPIDDSAMLVDLCVRPLTELADDAALFLIVFRERGVAPNATVAMAPNTGRVLEQLENELEATKEHLQTTIEELETSNEELKSSNEELLSMNEELQSLNEEFETVNAELKRKVEELDALNSDLDNLLRSTQIPTVFLDTELRIRRFTPAASDVFNVIDSDLGRPITDLSPRFAAASLPGDAREVLRSLAPMQREVALDQGDRCYVLRMTPYRTLDNVIDGVVVTFVDVTMVREAEAQRARLAAVVDGATEAIISKSLDGRIQSWNRAAEQMYGYRAEEAIGQHIGIIIPPERSGELASIMERLQRGERVPRFETERIDKHGGRLFVSLTISPILDAAGRVIGASAIAGDVTAQKLAEQALRNSEQRYRTLISATTAVVWTFDAAGNLTEPQDSWQQFTGQAPASYRGQGWLDAVHADDRERVHEAWERAVSRRSNFEMELRVWNRDRRGYCHMVARAAPVLEESGLAREWVGTLTDVTHEREVTDALRERADELRALFDTSAAGIVEADVSGRILRANRRFADVTGYSADEIRGMHFTDFTHADDREQNLSVFRDAIERGLSSYGGERRLVGKSGNPFFVQLSASILRGSDGAPSRVFAVLQDITERKLAEAALARAKQEAEAASRAKDQFLAVLSHELRTPLTPVLAAASKLERTETLSDGGRQTVRMIQRNVELESRLIDDLLDLTRISRGRMELRLRVVDAARVLAQALDIVSIDLDAKGLTVHHDLEEGCYVHADPARLQQVFWNLLNNSVKFTAPGGTVSVSCRRDGVEHVVAEVSDTGTGIDDALLPHVFDAFEQGERGREGLGLGLAISRALVELHGGRIVAESEGIGHGATFRVALPATAEAPISPPRRRPDSRAETTARLAVLLVEDHADSAQLMRELLELSGHDVAQAGTVADAIRCCERRAFDLLLSDLGLPDGSGLELVRRLRSSGCVRHAIALSGYGMEEDLTRSREAGFDEHLVKPVNPRDLEDSIRRVTRSG